ncbi:hypothetical protein GALMADRAFT_254694 [Galerina marginata CBS 339.88]|uniref:DUF967 domain protein n=1 Tax=Galerina marginata (strain CBS 339.88) TaxID=685588 RepID=A0A067SIB5_GALM3|nr:hypothetical protein GALMADRAFT_254694 [Galerina marginata CBS 339.88]
MSDNTFPTLQALADEEKSLVFKSFTAESAWTLGCILREMALPSTKPVAIRIIHANGQILFSTFTRTGTVTDSETWLARKAASVFRWGISSLHLGSKLRAAGHKGALVSEVMVADDEKYACHGGGFPIKVDGVEGVVAVVIVSGLAQLEDHMIVVDGIKKYLKEVENKAL